MIPGLSNSGGFSGSSSATSGPISTGAFSAGGLNINKGLPVWALVGGAVALGLLALTIMRRR